MAFHDLLQHCAMCCFLCHGMVLHAVTLFLCHGIGNVPWALFLCHGIVLHAMVLFLCHGIVQYAAAWHDVLQHCAACCSIAHVEVLFCVVALLFVMPHCFGAMALCIVSWHVFLCWSIVAGSAALHHAACFTWFCINVHVPTVVVAFQFWHTHTNNNNNQPLWHWSSMLFVVLALFHCDFLLQWLVVVLASKKQQLTFVALVVYFVLLYLALVVYFVLLYFYAVVIVVLAFICHHKAMATVAAFAWADKKVVQITRGGKSNSSDDCSSISSLLLFWYPKVTPRGVWRKSTFE